MFASRRSRVLLTSSIGVIGTIATMSHYTSYADSSNTKKDKNHQKIVIIGGGTAGLGIAAQLRNAGMKDITIIEPSSKHYYQPLWTLVGAGLKDNSDSVKDMKDILPTGVKWIQDKVITFQPNQNQISLSKAENSDVEYDYLIVAAGLNINWSKIPGLEEGLAKPDSGVVSIYDYHHSQKTFKTFEKLQTSAERMIFTVPAGLIKCAGAPQKIMWLLEDALRNLGLRERATVEFHTAGPAMFGIPKYAQILEKLRKERGVIGRFKHELVSIDVEKKIAFFKDLEKNEIHEEKYDFLHVTPPMSAPEFIKTSPLAGNDGWMEVDKNTLQSTKYPNIFGLGDCTNTPNSKTAAAITAQAPVLVHNLLNHIEGKPLNGYYNGYASCPLIVKHNRVILAEFGYGGKIMESFNPETGKFPLTLIGQDGEYSQQFFYWLKEQFFPFAYWSLWVRGMWYGTNGPFKPDVTKRDEAPPAK